MFNQSVSQALYTMLCQYEFMVIHNNSDDLIANYYKKFRVHWT